MKKIKCGSTWVRPVDGAIIEIIAIEGRKVFINQLDGPKLLSNTLNFGVIEVFWNLI